MIFRKPRPQDGAAIWTLVKETGVLDVNSVYLYILLGRDFSDTSVLVEEDGAVVGFITGYIPPTRPDRLFIWQVGVAEAARGKGLAGRMIMDILRRQDSGQIRYLETTVSPSNQSSHRLFAKAAKQLDTELTIEAGFDETLFPGGNHEAEPAYLIGPFNLDSLQREKRSEA